jgi:3-hydroxy-9,10-secoandrosta-1,3,5(10)-triene-9,17-dione monooxygenase
MVEKIDELCEIIFRNRDHAEATAQLAPGVRAAGGKAGLWKLAAPSEFGGSELPLPELQSTFERLGEADPTAAWHAVNSIPAGLMAAHLEPSVVESTLADSVGPFGYSGAVAAGVVARRADGGYLLDGTWPFMTGARDAEWAVVVARATDAEGKDPGTKPDFKRLIVQVADLDVHDTWTAASGMRGTGSHAVSAHEVFVPDEQTTGLVGRPRINRPLYRVAAPILFLPPCAAMAVGMLRSATTAAVAFLEHKVSRFDGHTHYDAPRTLQVIADATAVTETTGAGLGALVEEYWSVVAEGHAPSEALLARLWSTVFYTFDIAREHISDIYATGTSSTYATQNPIDRALRDIHAISAAFDSFQTLRRAAGRVLLGHDAQHPMFI